MYWNTRGDNGILQAAGNKQGQQERVLRGLVVHPTRDDTALSK